MVSFLIDNTWQEIIPPDSVGTISNENNFKINIAILPASPTNENFFTYNAYEKIAFNIPDGSKLFIKTNGIIKKGKIRIDEDSLFSAPTTAKLLGANGEAIGSLNGALDIHDADVHDIPFNELFHRHTGAATTLAVASLAGATSITVVDATGFIIGTTFQIENGVIETTFPTVTLVVGNTLTLDRPLDNPFSIGDNVEAVDTNMAVAGTLLTPIAFRLIPNKNQVWHIVRFLLGMTHSGAADDSKFGDLPVLPNGVVLRAFNATANQHATFTLWKDNGDLKMDMFDILYSDKAGAGLFGTNGRGSIKLGTGAVPKISGANGDYLEILIQDDLTALTSFQLKGQGHLEDA